MSIPVECLLCTPPRTFQSRQEFDIHADSKHGQTYGQYEAAYLAHLDQEHLEDAK
jgi:hypothetical protein